MKKNKIMRFASAIMVMTLLSTCMVGGTFAKYVTEASSSDKARVAYWGFQADNSMELKDLFADAYGTTVDSVDGADVIAPGTAGEVEFVFAWDEEVSAYGSEVDVTGPEVAYTFTVSTEGSVCDDLIKDNSNIQWKLDSGEWGTWDKLMSEIAALSGDSTGTAQYDPNTLPVAFTAGDDSHTIYWQWLIDDGSDTKDAEENPQNVKDTAMGNAAELDDVAITITITATQIG